MPEQDPSLGIAAVWCVVSGLLTVVLGEALFKTLARWLMTRKWNQHTLARYRHWGMEDQVLRRPYRWVEWVIILPLYALHLSITYLLAVPVAMNTAPFRDHPSNLIALWLVVLLMPFLWRLAEYSSYKTKMEQLDALRPVFHARFPVTEILSMYECLKVVPRIFWEEYTNLPAVQINEATNRRFRERVAPYSNRTNENIQRAILWATIIAVLLATLTVVQLVIDGAWIQWLQRQVSG